MNKPPDIEQVLSAVSSLYSGQDADQRTQANKWLLELEGSVFAWQLADQLLFRSASPESTYFAAHIMRVKVQRSFHELPADAYESLRDSLLVHITKPGHQHATLIQLCIALTDLGHQVTAWSDFTSHVISALRAASPDNVPALLELITIIPEEVGSRHLRLGENRRRDIIESLGKNAPVLLELLGGYVLQGGSAASNPHNLTLIFCCLSSWFEVNAISYSHVIGGNLVSLAFNVLAQPMAVDADLHRASSDCVCSAWVCADGLEDDHRQLAEYLLAHTATLTDPYHTTVAAEDSGKCGNIIRVFSECADTLLEEVVKAPGEGLGQMFVLEQVMTCVGHYDYELCDITFNVWYRLSEMLYCKRSEAHNAVFRPYIERLILALFRHCQLEPDLSADALPDTDRDFAHFRHQANELLQDMVFLVGSDKCFHQMFSLLQASSGSWERIEAALYIMSGVGRSIGNTDGGGNEVITQVLSAILLMPDTTHLAVRLTSTTLIGELHQWVERHPDMLEAVLTFLMRNLQQSALLAPATAHSLFLICSSSRKHLTQHLAGLVQIIQSLDTLSITDTAALDLIKSTSAIISQLAGDDMLHWTRLLSSIQLQQLNKLKVENGGGDSEQHINPQLWLDRLAAIFQQLTSTSTSVTSTACLQPLVIEIWPLLSHTLTRYEGEVDVVERYCRCLRFLVRCLGTASRPILAPMVEQVVDAYSRHQHSCYLYLTSILVDEFGSETSCVPGLIGMLRALLPPTELLLNTATNSGRDGFQNHPDTLEDLFRLGLRLVQRCPMEFLTGEFAPSFIKCAVEASTVNHREANASIMKFLAEVFSPIVKRTKVKEKKKTDKDKTNANNVDVSNETNANTGSLRAIKLGLLQDVGGRFTERVISGCLDIVGTYMLPDIAEVLYNMLKLDHVLLTQWLQESIAKVPGWIGTKLKRPVVISPQQMTELYQRLVSAEDERQVCHALKDFTRLFK